MAFDAVGRIMRSGKRKPAEPVDSCDIAHKPGVGIVTARAIRPRGLLVHIGVARNTGLIGFIKHQAGMTGFTV